MKLKALEIEGFKSFVDKTSLKFDKSITGIVGPNGCGKSNVVDAIRWVMGEQSAKHLRGKSMEDVIFTGAKDRGPSSIATVELTFSTLGAQTPPQYTDSAEISIGRRLYRSGESEYFINKQIVRLKDVRELFLGTGVGSNAYSIIEQGSIGALVTAKPEDRRRIVEEAAGISKFQIRKVAAERRMEATEQNLLRLKDVIHELERQKNSLERQAKKAEKFKVVRDELRELDCQMAALDYKKFSEKEQALLKTMKELDIQSIEAQSKLAENENIYQERRLKLAVVEREAADLQQRVYEWDNILNITEAKLQTKKTENERIERQHQTEVVRTTELKKALDATHEARSEAIAKVVQIDFDVIVQKEELEALEKDFHKTEETSVKLFEELEQARIKSQEASKTNVKLITRKQAVLERLEKLEGQKEKIAAEFAQAAQKFDKLERLNKSSQQGLANIKQMKFSLDSQSEEVATHLKNLEQQILCEKSVLEQIKEKCLTKKSRLASLEELEKSFEGYQDGPKTVLERKRSGEADYILGAMADFIELKPEYENAVSAVMGEQMQCLVVDQPHQSVEAAGLLKSLGTGRSSFVARHSFFNEPVITERKISTDLETADGYQGLLRHHVDFKNGFEQLKSLFLGDTVLVSDLSKALDIWERFRHPVVTLDGEMISSTGVLSGGNLEKTSKALLEKKREIKDLQLQVQDIINEVKQKEETCFDLDHRFKSLKADFEGMKKSTQEETIRISNQEKDLEHIQKEMMALNETKQKFSREKLTLEQERDQLLIEEQDIQSAEAAEGLSLESSQNLIDSKKTEEEYYRNKLDEKREAMTRAKIVLAERTARDEDLNREIERLSAELEKIRVEIFVSEEKASFFTKQILFNRDRIRFIEKNIGRILEQKEKVGAAYQKQKNHHDDLSKTTQQVEIDLKEIRCTYQVIKDKFNEESLALQEARNHLSRIIEQIFERYQLPMTDVVQKHGLANADFDYHEAALRAEELREQLVRAGSVNIEAIDELDAVTERFEFLEKQRQDLSESLDSLMRAIEKINETTRVRFSETFELINQKFSALFPRLFHGGEAYLKLTDPENILETGVDIIAQPPGKRLQSISLLSGGEKALTAVSLLFAIFLIKPSPFCLLDEVDAPLDDANVDRYNEIVKEMSQKTQFIVITHNKRTMQSTEVLFGVTMEKSGISQLVSVDLSVEAGA